jgi:hypothetical protein
MKLRIAIKIPNWLDKFFTWPVLRYRLWKYGYPYRRIPLTEGKFTIVDQQDFYELNNFDWVADGKGDCIYALRHIIISANKKDRMVRMHRYIMKAPDELLVDHRNGDGLDNRRSNLRLATVSENNCNKPKRKNTSSHFVGVSFDKGHRHWSACIQYNGKRIWLGYFDSEIEAARAYDAAARKYHGEFARLNFPDLTAENAEKT